MIRFVDPVVSVRLQRSVMASARSPLSEHYLEERSEFHLW